MKTLSINDASRSGLSGLVASAEAGTPVALSRHGRVVAEVVSAEEMAMLREAKDSLLETAIVMARFATDNGNRTELDDVIETLGFNRAELEAELGAEIAAGEV